MKTGRIIKAAAWICLSCFLLSGCGESFPVLTQQEYDLIVDYSAGVLSKYNTLNDDRLTRVPPEVPEENVEEEPASENAPAPEQDKPQVKPETTPEPAGGSEPSSEPAGTPEPVQDEGTSEPSEETGSDESGTTPVENVSEFGNDDLMQRMQSGIHVDLNGYYVLNSYPDHEAKPNTALTAEPGKKLLILSFTLTNVTAGTVDMNYLDQAAAFTLLLNGTPVSKNLVTLLENDLSTMKQSIGAGEDTGAVLCFQVTEEQAKTIDTLHLKVNVHGEEQTLRVE